MKHSEYKENGHCYKESRQPTATQEKCATLSLFSKWCYFCQNVLTAEKSGHFLHYVDLFSQRHSYCGYYFKGIIYDISYVGCAIFKRSIPYASWNCCH